MRAEAVKAPAAPVAQRKPRSGMQALSVAPAVAPSSSVAVVPIAVPVEPPEPAAPASPESACAGKGFFARQRCLVELCAQPAYQSNTQCTPVRRQQQIEEEKRDPSKLN
jgi:hypothetical protein